MSFYQVSLPGGITAVLEVSPDRMVTSAAPVLKHAVGLSIRKVTQWVEKKGGSVRLVSGPPASGKTREP